MSDVFYAMQHIFEQFSIVMSKKQLDNISIVVYEQVMNL